MCTDLNLKTIDAISGVFQKIYVPTYELQLFDEYAEPKILVDLRDAFLFCQNAHGNQVRLGPLNRPYTDHPLMVWYLSYILGGNKTQQLAALLHDVVEDCQSNLNLKTEDIFVLLKGRFTLDISNLVCELSIFTDDDTEELEIISNFSAVAKLDKAADNFANLWDLIYDGPIGYSKEKHAYIIEFREEVHSLCQPLPCWFNEAFHQLALRAKRLLLT
tara:strand:+ start:61518 stop:62168 length:651 start_codon:yes stop_codon:yes gene_type:complete